MLHDFAGIGSRNPVSSCHLSMSMYLVLDYQVVPFEENWRNRQPTDRNTDRENESRIDYDNKVVTKYSHGRSLRP